jgi:hypothetical protein
MTVRVLLLLLVTSMSCAAAQKLGSWVILPLAEGPKLLAQCSRSSPGDAVTRFWTPSAAQIQALEQRLPSLLRKSGHDIVISRFHRQYIGFILHGKKLIYLNAFPADDIASWHSRANWRTTAWIVCDGGDDYWGVEFDPATQTFHDLAFNGVA